MGDGENNVPLKLLSQVLEQIFFFLKRFIITQKQLSTQVMVIMLIIINHANGIVFINEVQSCK